MANQPQGSGVEWIIGGAIVGGFASALCVNAIPNLSYFMTVFLASAISFLGVVLGYTMAWAGKVQGKKRFELEIQAERHQTFSPQVVGKKCRDCKASIMFIGDANVYPNCHHVVCKKCQPRIPCSDCERVETNVEESADR